MNFNKPITLLFFLVCFCFISTSFTQSCMPESKVTDSYTYLYELEENNEAGEYLTTSLSVTRAKQTNELSPVACVENIPSQHVVCCNRDPPFTIS
jgi:hypothetical protein